MDNQYTIFTINTSSRYSIAVPMATKDYIFAMLTYYRSISSFEVLWTEIEELMVQRLFLHIQASVIYSEVLDDAKYIEQWIKQVKKC